MKKTQLLLLVLGLIGCFSLVMLSTPYMKVNPPLIIINVFSLTGFIYLFIQGLSVLYQYALTRKRYNI